MCIDDGCDELICCLCAPLAAIFCCKLCKDKMNNNNVQQAPESGFYSQPTGPVPLASVYGPQGYGPQGYDARSQNRPQFYPGGPMPYSTQQQTMQTDYFPPMQGYSRNNLPTGYIKQQPRPYQ